jgi:PKD repeat protein
MTKIFTLSLALLYSVGCAYAQQINEPCATMEQDKALREKYPQLGTLDNFERELQRKIIEIKAKQAAARGLAEVITIPVVVHIIHNGEAVGQGRNISEAQVKSQIETINEDFRRKRGTRGFNDDPRGADIEIDFCLAQLNPQGVKMAEAGIDRINGSRANWTRNDIEGSLKPSTFWDPNKYFNIWVVEIATQDQLVGYAQFPTQSGLQGLPTNGGPASTDGVVIATFAFGNAEKGSFSGLKAPYNLGRALTHETGHWLGLRHIWGDANCGNDFCDDTPAQASESRGCQKGRMSCGTTNMVENYMDYSDDGCFNIFTANQKTRMRAVMEMSPRRNSLVTSNLCGTTISAKPAANFQAENRTVLLGSQVRFTDLSSNFPNKWQWDFEGGDPASSTEQNPVVTYNTPGKFKVTLVASNNLGASNGNTKTAYIEVLNQGLCATVTNFNGTATLVRTATGYVAGQNSKRTKAVSDYFDNTLGYNYLRGASIRFAVAKAAKGKDTEALVRITAWNARGIQNGPGAVLETKEVPLRRILEDVAANRPTNITFDRSLPLFSLPYHIGVEFDYAAGDTVALFTTRDGQSTSGTSWEQNNAGEWDRYIVRNGLNIAHAISAQVGMKPSVQIQASAQFIDPGKPVILQARGASVFNWSPSEGLNTTLGPQVIASPTRTITYSVKGSGGDICIDTAQTTIYVSNVKILSSEPPYVEANLSVSPNPTDGTVQIAVSNKLRGTTLTKVYNSMGRAFVNQTANKTADKFTQMLNLRNLQAGSYIVELRIGNWVERKKIWKY